MKMTFFRDVSPCSLGEVYPCFRSACCLHRQDNELNIIAYSSLDTVRVTSGYVTTDKLRTTQHVKRVMWSSFNHSIIKYRIEIMTNLDQTQQNWKLYFNFPTTFTSLSSPFQRMQKWRSIDLPLIQLREASSSKHELVNLPVFTIWNNRTLKVTTNNSFHTLSN